jgi:hypothetical protein
VSSETLSSSFVGAIGHWVYQAKEEEEEEINVVLFVNEINELKRLQSVTNVCQHLEYFT